MNKDVLFSSKTDLWETPQDFFDMLDAEQLQRIWREVEALSGSVRDGYVSAPDLIRVLREEYEIDIIGG